MTTNNDKPTISKKESVVVVSKMEIPNNGTWYTERAYKELLKEKRLLEVIKDNRDGAITDLTEENQKLKELLKECNECIRLQPYGYSIEMIDKLLTKIDEALK